MMTVLFLTIMGVGQLAFVVAFFTLCDREKRFPSPIYMIELTGRWCETPADRRDPWVSVAVVGFMVGLVGMIGCIAVAFWPR